MIREALAESIQHLSDEFSIDERIDRLLVLEKIEKGRQQYRDGNTLTNEEAKDWLSKWLK